MSSTLTTSSSGSMAATTSSQFAGTAVSSNQDSEMAGISIDSSLLREKLPPTGTETTMPGIDFRAFPATETNVPEVPFTSIYPLLPDLSNIRPVSSSRQRTSPSKEERLTSPTLTDSRHKRRNSRQYKINGICSCMTQCKISTREELMKNWDALFKLISSNPRIFKPHYTPEKCFQIFLEAVEAYNNIYSLKVTVTEKDYSLFAKTFFSFNFSNPNPVIKDDLTRVTQSYDILENSQGKLEAASDGISGIIKDVETVVCSHVILGTGDTGTTIWLEKYKDFHNQSSAQIAKGQIPDVLMIGDSFGSWKHDYTLAQPHNLLERGMAYSNPSSFVSEDYYHSNPYTNARHIYQSNVVNLAKTEAPILSDTTVQAIQKRENHKDDWYVDTCKYRLIVKTPMGVKCIYTNDIDICTGLGAARNAIRGKVISEADFDRLSVKDAKKGFTPIVDGNKFMLTDSEENSTESRTIVIYGGGGTAAACYRKAFFGNDIRTEPRDFEDSQKKNSAVWIAARGFEAAGSGKLVTKILNSTKERNEQLLGELVEIAPNPMNGKLKLRFKVPSPPSSPTGTEDPKVSYMEIECDQLVHSLGQDDVGLRDITRELDRDLELRVDSTGMPLNVRSKDGDVHFFGAAAMSIRTKEYSDATWKWLHKENIGGDVGPGSMPPSRAQIKQYLSLKGSLIETVNANMDNSSLILRFISDAGVTQNVSVPLIKDILEYRKQSTAGFSQKVLQDLLKKHQLEDKFEIVGHCHLVRK